MILVFGVAKVINSYLYVTSICVKNQLVTMQTITLRRVRSTELGEFGSCFARTNLCSRPKGKRKGRLGLSPRPAFAHSS